MGYFKDTILCCNGHRIQKISTSIAKCKQTKSMSISQYYGKLNSLWEKLHHHKPLISCACCSACTASDQHTSHHTATMLHNFLTGLDSDYAQTRQQIMAQDPLPFFDRAYQVLIQAECLRLSAMATVTQPLHVLTSLDKNPVSNFLKSYPICQ